MKLALLATLALFTLVVAAPMAAAEDPEDPPEGCTTKVTDEVAIFNPISGRKIVLVPETWLCPPPL